MMDTNVLQWLEAAEKEHGNRIAAEDPGQRLTYRELGSRSRMIGTALADKIQTGDPVVILKEKSCMTLAVLFGVVYAGGFYVCVDPAQPAERLQKILDVLQTRLIITGKEQEKLLRECRYSGEVTEITELWKPGETDQGRLQKIRENSRDTDPLYGIFTSGSTGNPKGIVVSHKAVLRFISHFTDIFGICTEDRIANQAPFDFDVSVKDIYSCLRTGAELVIIPTVYFATPPRLLDYICDKKTTVMIWAVSALVLITALKGLEYRVPSDIRMIMFSGEVMPGKHLQLWREALPQAEFVNLYGPSEITCNCTYYRIGKEFSPGSPLPIGKAFPGRKVFLTDKARNVIEDPGILGEICVAGESLSEGYYHAPEQTAAHFLDLENPDGVCRRTYLTGDLASFDQTGDFHFAGRKDFQIKLMGHRIELEEIEAAVLEIASVSQCCCLFDSQKKRIWAFFTGTADSREVRSELKNRLPVYMVPSKYERLDTMPLNQHGKTDRGQLKKMAGITD